MSTVHPSTANHDRLIREADMGPGSNGDFDATAGGRVLLRRCNDYAAAQRLVDTLSDHHFPVEHTAIVARGLSIVEQVTGRLNWGRAFLQGLGSGAFMGLFIGALLGLLAFSPIDWLSLLVWTTAIAAVFGGLFRVIGYASTGGRRDFTSLGSLSAEHFDVMVESEYKDKAESLLAGVQTPSN